MRITIAAPDAPAWEHSVDQLLPTAMREEELRGHAECTLCHKKVGHTGVPTPNVRDADVLAPLPVPADLAVLYAGGEVQEVTMGPDAYRQVVRAFQERDALCALLRELEGPEGTRDCDCAACRVLRGFMRKARDRIIAIRGTTDA